MNSSQKGLLTGNLSGNVTHRVGIMNKAVKTGKKEMLKYGYVITMTMADLCWSPQAFWEASSKPGNEEKAFPTGFHLPWI